MKYHNSGEQSVGYNYCMTETVRRQCMGNLLKILQQFIYVFDIGDAAQMPQSRLIALACNGPT